jgi:hypothetical protein
MERDKKFLHIFKMVFSQKAPENEDHCKTSRHFMLHKETAHLCLLLFLLGGKFAKGFVGKCTK